LGRGGVSFFGYGPAGHSGGWKLRPWWHRLMGAVVTPGWPVTLPCARVNPPWPWAGYLRSPGAPSRFPWRTAGFVPPGHRPSPTGDVLLVKSGPVGTPWAHLTTQKRPGAISRPYHTCVVFGVYAVPTRHTHRSPHAGPKTCGWVHSRPTPRIFGACLGPNKRAQSAEPPLGP